MREEGGRKGRTRESFPVSTHLVTRVVCFCLTIKGICGGYYTVGSLMVSVFNFISTK